MLKRLIQSLKSALGRLFGDKAGAAAPRAKKSPKPQAKKKTPPGAMPEAYSFSLKTAPAGKAAKPAKPKPLPAEDAGEPAAAEMDLRAECEKKDKRKAFRVSIRGLDAVCAEARIALPCLDLSACGIGLQYQGRRVKGGTLLTLTLRLSGQILAQDLPVKVMRHEGGVLGCAFLDLNRTQEDAVYKIVVDAQRGGLHTGTGKPAARQGAKPAVKVPAKAPAGSKPPSGATRR